MKPKLPRVLLWTEKATMDEFFKDSVNTKLFDFYLEVRSFTSPGLHRLKVIRLFNEIYYQLTRVEYENDPNLDLDVYIQDIKANIGMLHSTIFVLNMMYVLLEFRQNNSPVTLLFKKMLFNRCMRYGDRNDFARYPIDNSIKAAFKVDLTPKPRNVADLRGEVLQWDEITNNFESSSIKEVLSLWHSRGEKIDVLHMIEDAYMRKRRRVVKFKEAENYSPLMADYNFFSDLYYDLGDRDKMALYAAEDIGTYGPSYRALEEENYNLKKKISFLESDNERLRSVINPQKTKKNRERSFTLKMIVDYCKKHLNIDKSFVIVAMLNKFLRDARDYSQEECDLVDSIEIEYMNKKYGDTVMGDKNEFNGNSGLNQIALPPGMTPQEAIRLLQNKDK